MFTIKTIGAPATIGHLEIPGVDSDPILVKDPNDLAAVRRFFKMNVNLRSCYLIMQVEPKAEPKPEPEAAPKVEPKPAPKAEPRKVVPKVKRSKFRGKD